MDVLSLNILMSDESKREVHDYLVSPLSTIDSTGKLIYGLNDSSLLKFALFNVSHYPLPEKE